MATIGIFQAKTQLSEIVEKAVKGERTTITVRGRVSAAVVPVQPSVPERSAEELEAAYQRLRNPRITGISGEEVLAAIREGRR